MSGSVTMGGGIDDRLGHVLVLAVLCLVLGQMLACPDVVAARALSISTHDDAARDGVCASPLAVSASGAARVDAPAPTRSDAAAPWPSAADRGAECGGVDRAGPVIGGRRLLGWIEVLRT